MQIGQPLLYQSMATVVIGEAAWIHARCYQSSLEYTMAGALWYHNFFQAGIFECT